jgi:hypothetical protein
MINLKRQTLISTWRQKTNWRLKNVSANTAADF